MVSYCRDQEANTRNLIKDNFLQMYIDTKDLSKITISKLSKACNISRGTFYFYYEDSTSLYQECEKDIIAFLERGLLEVNLSTVRQDYARHVQTYSKYLGSYVEQSELLKTFLCGSEWDSFYKAFFESIMRYYKQAMTYAKGDMPPIKADYLIRIFASGHITLLADWIISGCKESTDMIADINAQILYRGLYSQES